VDVVFYRLLFVIFFFWTLGPSGRDRIVVGFTTTYAISAFPH